MNFVVVPNSIETIDSLVTLLFQLYREKSMKKKKIKGPKSKKKKKNFQNFLVNTAVNFLGKKKLKKKTFKIHRFRKNTNEEQDERYYYSN